MLKKCPECELQISDKALSCPHCGMPFQKQVPHKPKSKKHMRLPNGFGQIVCIKKSLRNPYRAMVTIGKNATGRPICKPLKPKAYFPTYNDAYAALLEYNKNPYTLEDAITTQELFDKWFEEYSKTLKSDSSERTITSAWAYCSEVYNMRAKDIRVRHIKACMESTPSPNIKRRIKSVFNLMLDYALEYELVDRNYARTFKTDENMNVEEQKKDHIAFTEEEIAKLWENINVQYVDLVLIQIYTGLRPQELCKIEKKNIDLEKMVMVGGMKTKAGKDRVIPIHSSIRNIIEKRLVDGAEYAFLDSNGEPLTYDKYRRRFDKVKEALNINPEHRCHDPRKTFVTLAKKYNVDEYAIKRLVGHSISDLTENIYTERDIDWLKEEMEKIIAPAININWV